MLCSQKTPPQPPAACSPVTALSYITKREKSEQRKSQGRGIQGPRPHPAVRRRRRTGSLHLSSATVETAHQPGEMAAGRTVPPEAHPLDDCGLPPAAQGPQPFMARPGWRGSHSQRHPPWNGAPKGGIGAHGVKERTAAQGPGRPPRASCRGALAQLQRSRPWASASSASCCCPQLSPAPNGGGLTPGPVGPRRAAAPAAGRHGRALGFARAPQPSAAKAPGAASLQRGWALTVGAVVAALLGLAGGAGPAGTGPQRHHPERPPAELLDGAAAHRLLPQRHRAGTARHSPSPSLR